jgi:autotransporter-associated beta strand protein
LSGDANLSVHTLQVDVGQAFTLGGGTLTFNTINLMPDRSAPGRILMSGDVHFAALGVGTATIAKGAGSSNTAYVDLDGGDRTFHVADGAATIDLSVNVPVIHGALTKDGAGALALTSTNTYQGDTTVLAGKLSVSNASFTNAADVYLATGGLLELNYAGGPDVIDSLFIDGVSQAIGTWGAVGSGADFSSPLIAGPGLLQVSTFIPPPLWGDYNDDGSVDAGDYVVWRNNLGGESALPNDDTPGVGTDDYERWRAHFGETNLNGLGSDSSAAVPEPATALLSPLASVLLHLACRRQRPKLR